MKRNAFTLVELLVVIAIIGVLVGLLLPAVQAAREAARRMSCSNNFKQLGLSLHNYHDTHQAFPLGATAITQGLSLHVALLPFMEQGNKYDRFIIEEVFNSANNRPLTQDAPMAMYICPSSPENTADDTEADYTTHYYGVMGPTGTNPQSGVAYKENTSGAHGGWSEQGLFRWGLKPKNFANIVDGTSNSLAFGEISWSERNGNATRYRAWTRGGQVNQYMAPAKNIARAINSDYTALFNDMSMGSEHPGGAMFGLCDGSVRFVSETINFSTYLSAASVNGRESDGL
ncbi:hypothetical protein FF011L_07880 [Roseimaritima multifibrata]|uniref:DUF1559 domain-containing protein n=1 Tax=Roseimaritima multifibrata TaxID=1930274 RepID=A0A517MAY7_9BACT|nr:DUF1559 domain-containing protein [Roseimaritima multifibrata]QDS92052.1 hypothetical protein FF011L_07880 [Roseimaritima multifibrata]